MTNVPQQPFGDTPPTWSPTWWSVTSGPTAVTTPAKSIPSCWRCPSIARVAAERDQHVGEVDAGRGDRDLDLSRSRRNPLEGDQFQRLQVTGRADLQTHAVALVVDDGGVAAPRAAAELGYRRAVYHCAVPPGGLVLLGPAEQLPCQLLGVGVLVDVDLGGAQMRMFGADHPHQAAQPGLLAGWARRPGSTVWALRVTT